MPASCEHGGRSCCRTHGGAMVSLQSAPVVSLHGLMTISCHVGVDVHTDLRSVALIASSCTSIRYKEYTCENIVATGLPSSTPSGSLGTGERKLVTVLCCTLDLSEGDPTAHDPEARYTLLQALVDVATPAIHHYVPPICTQDGHAGSTAMCSAASSTSRPQVL